MSSDNDRRGDGGSTAAGTGTAGAGRSFQEALEELERCVRLLDSGEPSLEESLRIFEKGVLLVRECQEKLDAAEARVAELTDGPAGVEERPFES